MQISITVDLIFKKIILYAELTTVETISLVAPSQSENLVPSRNTLTNKGLCLSVLWKTTHDDIDDKDNVL